MAILKDFGAKQDFSCNRDTAEIKEYVCVTEASAIDLQDKVIRQIDDNKAVEGNISEIFIFPMKERKSSGLYAALATAITYISGNENLTSNWFKETAGYTQENWRSLDKLLMRVRVERKVNGKYKVLFKGRPLSKAAAQMIGAAAHANIVHQRSAMGSAKSAFIDGGFSRTGKSGYGGARRLILTSAENFRSGMKIQIVGTVIDIICDVNDVYFKEEGSKDLSEFMGRAGVSIVKAGATAAIGSILTAVSFAVAAAFFTAGTPVVLGVMLAVGAYYLAATLVDQFDTGTGMKKSVAGWAR